MMFLNRERDHNLLMKPGPSLGDFTCNLVTLSYHISYNSLFLFSLLTAASLFGSSPSSSGGLFGAPASAPRSGGLFGAPAPAARGFSSAAPAGLFGAAPAPAGLFGAPAPANERLMMLWHQQGRQLRAHQQSNMCSRSLGGQKELAPMADETPDATAGAKRAANEVQNQGSAEDGGKRSKVSKETEENQRVNYALIPQILDSTIEKSGDGNAIRSTTIKTGSTWVRNRQENLLVTPKKQTLNQDEIKKDKNKAFDLLDALSCSG